MSAAAPRGGPKPKQAAQPPARTIRRFSDVDTDSDFEQGAADKPSRQSPTSLSFKTEATERLTEQEPRRKGEAATKNVEATSEGSILFESDSEADVAPAPPPAKAVAPSFQQEPPQSLAEKLFGNIAALKKPSPPPPSKQQPSPPPPPAQKAPASAPPPPVQQQPKIKESTPVVAAEARPKAVAQPSPPPAPPAKTPQPAAPQVKQQKQQEQQSALREPPRPSPPPAALTAAYGDALARGSADGGAEGNADGTPSDRKSDAGFAEAVLPMDGNGRAVDYPAQPPQQPQPAYVTPLREDGRSSTIAFASDGVVSSGIGGYTSLPSATSRRDPSEELLVRARLRLEEKRRNDATTAMTNRTATPTRRSTNANASGLLQSGHRGTGAATPRGTGFYAPSGSQAEPSPLGSYGYRLASLGGGGGGNYMPSHARPMTSTDAVGPAHMIESKLRRLTQENTRLQDEVTFLNRENQKLRAVAGSADSAENIRMQLTVDMLRKELQSKELDHQAALRDRDAEKAGLVNQVAELQDQNEGYAATASQYRKLYEEKQKEIEQLKMQFQRLAQDVNTLEHRQGNDAQQHQSELTAEREKVDKLLYLLEDIKRQRQHLHELNQQVQLELVNVSEEKARLKDSLESAEERLRQTKSVNEQTVQTLQQDVTRLKDALGEKDRGHAAQLREEQRINASLQQRLNEVTAEGRQEAERLRRSIEAIREDHKKALSDERERRHAVEDKLKRSEADFKASLASLKESSVAEYEKRAKQLRDEVASERQARETIELDADRLADEAERLREALAYQMEQFQTLSADFAHSEEMRDKAERQCGALSATLQDMMQNDEQQTRRVAQLEGIVAELQQRLTLTPYAGPGGFDSTGNLRGTAASIGESLAAQVQLLSGENERLTNECVRLASERDALIDENGKIAEELLKWKNEMRVFVSSQLKQTPQS